MSRSVIVVGSGAGGSTVARELAHNGFNVTIIEAGSSFSPLTRAFRFAYPLSRLGLIGGERTITRFFPHMKTDRVAKSLVVIRGQTTGGSTTLSCGNIVRTDRGLRRIGLNLTPEFKELERAIGVKSIPSNKWRPLTLRMYDAAKNLGLDPIPTPKAVDIEKCVSCGLCELGCATNAKWDARRFLDGAIGNGAYLLTETVAKKLIIENGQVKGVEAKKGKENFKFYSDVVVLAAGGIGTAQLLKASGLDVSDTLWLDIVATLGGVSKGAKQLNEPPMLWFTTQQDYILSPYVDVLSVWFHKPWRNVSVNNRVGLMVKLADSANGIVSEDGSVSKELTARDLKKIDEGLTLAKKVMQNAGVRKPFVSGMLNGGHLGGTVPLSKKDVSSMRPSYLPENLWLADLSLAPSAQGMPTILLASALALRVARKIMMQIDNKSF